MANIAEGHVSDVTSASCRMQPVVVMLQLHLTLDTTKTNEIFGSPT
jgi:hypothetical protein